MFNCYIVMTTIDIVIVVLVQAAKKINTSLFLVSWVPLNLGGESKFNSPLLMRRFEVFKDIMPITYLFLALIPRNLQYIQITSILTNL